MKRLALGVALSIAFGAGVAVLKARDSTRIASAPIRPKRPKKKAPSPPPDPYSEATSPLADRARPPEGAPNIVWVIGCSVRRERAYNTDIAPFLGQLAADGVRFDDAISAAPWTGEAVAAMVTGDHVLRGQGAGSKLGNASELVSERFARSGWVVLGATATSHTSRLAGFAQGFDHFRSADARWKRKNRKSARVVVDDAIEMLDHRRPDELERPFFIQLMLVDAHAPRSPPAEEVKRFRGVAAPVAAYDASVAVMDQGLGRLIQLLGARGIHTDNTYIVFTADHGEGLAALGGFGGHGREMSSGTLRIPWVIDGPDLETRVVEGLASGIDVGPTLLGLAGLDSALGSGLDLSGVVRGEARQTGRREAFSSSMFQELDLVAVWTPTAQCTETACFDRTYDPLLRNPVQNDAVARALADWRASLSAPPMGGSDTGIP